MPDPAASSDTVADTTPAIVPLAAPTPPAPSPPLPPPAPRPFRIFVSSPGDLGDERVLCARVITRLRAEFAHAAPLQSILWEQEPLTADAGFQDQIPLPAETDLVIVLLWSRLGYRLHPKYQGAGDAEAPTGTLFEFRNALEGSRAHPDRRPDLLVYRKTAEPSKPSITDEAAWNKTREEWRKVEDFFNSAYFREQAYEGAFTGSYHTFDATADFEETLETHLRKMIARRLGEPPPPGVHSPDAAPAAITWTRGSPFRGLEHFDFEHADIFFGRARAAAEIRDALRRQATAGSAFLLVLGASGGGKSSLVRAGVLPDLVKPGVVEGIGLWRRVIFRPGATPAGGDLFDGLAEALCRPGAGGEEGVGLPELLGGENDKDADDTPAALAARLRANPAGADALLGGGLRLLASNARHAERETLLRHHARLTSADAGRPADPRTLAALDLRLAALAPPRVRLVLVLDQLEELFTDARFANDPDARAAFLTAIAALARGRRVWVIATLRSDFFAKCEAEPLLAELKAGAGTYHLLPPGDAELAQMIRKPALAAGLRFEEHPDTGEGLDDVLLAAAARDPAALPLLEFCLEELFKAAAGKAEGKRQKAEGQSFDGDPPSETPPSAFNLLPSAFCLLSHAAYEAMGGVEGALARRAEETFQRLRPWQQGAFDHVFRGLTTLAADDAPDAPPIRRRAVFADLTRPAGARDFVDAFLAPDARLFLADRDEAAADQHATVAVTHEALLTAWPRLRDWLRANREFLRARARLAGAAALWRQEREDRHHGPAVLRRRPGAAALWRQEREDAGYLLAPGKPLAEAEDLLASHGEDLSGPEQEFVLASMAAARERLEAERRRARRVLTVVSAALVVAVVFGVASYWQFREARRQESEARRQENEARRQEQVAKAAQADAEQEKNKAIAASEAWEEAETSRAKADVKRDMAEAQRDVAEDTHRGARTDASEMSSIITALLISEYELPLMRLFESVKSPDIKIESLYPVSKEIEYVFAVECYDSVEELEVILVDEQGNRLASRFTEQTHKLAVTIFKSPYTGNIKVVLAGKASSPKTSYSVLFGRRRPHPR